MTQEKKMYVVFCEDNEKYWCSYNTWSDQLRKATIFHSTKYANEVHKRFKELRLKNVEVRMGVVPEKPTNADRIRSMSDEELAEEIGRSSIPELCDIVCGVDCKAAATFNTTSEKRCADFVLDWLQQPAEVNE